MAERDPRIDAIAASDLSSAVILAALIGMLGAKGALADEEVREVYEQALYASRSPRALFSRTLARDAAISLLFV